MIIAAANTPATLTISGGLTLGGGTLNFSKADATVATQTFAGTTLTANTSSTLAQSSAGGGVDLLTNTGTIAVNGGLLTVNAFAGTSNAGDIELSNGATLSTAGNALANAAGGRIGGNGTLDLAGATLTNSGTIGRTEALDLLAATGVATTLGYWGIPI